MTLGKIRSYLYGAARILGDVNAIRKGPSGIEKRIERRFVGRIAGRLIAKVTK